MGYQDDHEAANGTDPILDAHGDVRRRFVKLWNERTCGDPGEPTLAAAWQALANLLENHPTSQERTVETF